MSAALKMFKKKTVYILYYWKYTFNIGLNTLWEKGKLLIELYLVFPIMFYPYPHTTNLKQIALNHGNESQYLKQSLKHFGKRRKLIMMSNIFFCHFKKFVCCIGIRKYRSTKGKVLKKLSAT